MTLSPAARAVAATLTELGPGTATSIAALADLDNGTTVAALRSLIRAGAVHVADTGDPARRVSTTVYALGEAA